jgi:hypothetical protein
MNCEEARARLDAFLGDELDGNGHAEMIEHLAGCSGCRERASARDPLKVFTSLAGRRADDPDFWAGHWEGIAGELDERSRRRGMAGWLTPAWRPALAAAAFCLLAVGLFLVRGPGVSTGVPDGPVADEDLRLKTPGVSDMAGIGNEADIAAEEVDRHYTLRLAAALPADAIVRLDDAERELKLISVAERDAGQASHYYGETAGGEWATVTNLQGADEMNLIITGRAKLDRGDEGDEEINLVTFESEAFPFD